MSKPLIAALAAGILIAGGLLWAGPRPITLADTPTGDPTLSTLLRDHAPAGAHRLSAVIVDGDDVTYAGLGADEKDLFEIGSVTKTMTAQTLDALVRDSTVTLETTVAEIYPEAVGTEVQDITLHDLATHTSGLPRNDNASSPLRLAGFVLFGMNPNNASADAILASTLTTSPDKDGYSNFGFSVLGELLARAAGVPFPDLLTQSVLDPAQMTTAYVMSEGNVPDHEIRGLRANGRIAHEWDDLGGAPAGGVRASAEDMGHFGRYLLDQGIPDYTWVPDPDRPGTYWHNGGTGGFSTMTIINPERDLFVTVLSDTTTGVEELGETLIDATISGD